MADVKETRIGLVLNGGVSLAVWMGGVTHEIDLLRRASLCAAGLDDGKGVAGYDRRIFDGWVAFCREHQVGRVLVDVIAGTSAGGLNGALLATAVGRGVPLDPVRPDATGPRLREMWDRSARLEHHSLLRAPDEPAIPSVLDGDFFERTVRTELHGIAADDGVARDDEPVTLFTTATALGSAEVRYTDSFDHPFDVADHRRLYRFMRTEPSVCTYEPKDGQPDDVWFPRRRVNDFDPPAPPHGPIDPLTRAARATASFPIAFAPVEETTELVRHRLLPPRQQRSAAGATWLADGGILNNSPFEPVLDAITSRQVSGEVDRLLIYVVPSEGVRAVDWKQEDDAVAQGGGTSIDGDARTPAAPTAGPPPMTVDRDTWKSIVAKALSLPGETDLRSDIDVTHELVSLGEGTGAGPESLFSDAIRRLAEPDARSRPDHRQLERSAAGLCAQYRLARTVGGLREVRAELGVAAYGPSRSLRPGLVDDAPRLLDDHRPVWVPPADGGLRPDAYDDRADGWCWGLNAAERVARLMLRDLRRTPPPVDDLGTVLATISAAQAHIEAVRTTVIDRIRRLDRPELFGRDHDGDVALIEEVGALFGELRVPVALLWCINEAAVAYASVIDGVEPDDVVRVGLAVEVASQAFTAYRPSERTPPFKLLRLGPDVDTPVCDRDRRPSTADGDDGVGEAASDRKLYGARLGHFGAFGLASWRAWDWMCGRLDAQAHLVRALAGQAPGTPAVEDAIVGLQAATLDTEGDGLSPSAFASRRGELLDQTDADLLDALGTTEQGRMLNEVFDAAMRAIPQPLALDVRGQLINTLLARRPQQRWQPRWAGLARFVTRWWWRRRVRSLTRGGRR